MIGADRSAQAVLNGVRVHGDILAERPIACEGRESRDPVACHIKG